MKRLQQLGLAAAMILATTCGLAGTASATTVEPANTEFTMTSTNSAVTFFPENVPYSCTSSTITADTGPLSASTWSTATITSLTFAGCTVDTVLLATVTTSERCQTPGSRPTLELMGATAGTAVGRITLPIGCDIVVTVVLGDCTTKITGGQTIGNGTAGAGGIDWTNRSPKSVLHFNSAHIPVAESNGVMGCVTAGAHTGALIGDYSVSSATNLTVTP
jgi:hypothetical protein